MSSSLNDWETLLASFSHDVEIVLLDPHQNGVAQIAAHLAPQTLQKEDTQADTTTGSALDSQQTAVVPVSNSDTLYDAIHILSHGSAGHLYLGTTDLNSNNLTDYQSQLQQIGTALTDTGDLLLYGCNVAEGDVGNQFITALAEVTGADVAASDDLTGAAALGGDWVLESITGDVSTTPFTTETYSSTLDNAINKTLAFLVENASIWQSGALSWGGTLWDYQFGAISFPSLELPGGGDASITIDKFDFGITANASISGGAFDLSYPIDYTVDLPSNVHPGDFFTIDTDFINLINPRFAIDDPGFDLSIGAEAAMKLSGQLNAGPFDLSASLDTGGSFTVFDFADFFTQDYWFNKNSDSSNDSFFSIAYDPNGLDKDKQFLLTSSDFEQLEILATPDTPLLKGTWDIDDTFGFSKGLDIELKDSDFSDGETYKAEGGLLSANGIIGASYFLRANTQISGVEATLTPTVGDSQTGMLGDDFQFFVPDNFIESSFDISASYQLLGSIDFTFGIQFEAGIEIKLAWVDMGFRFGWFPEIALDYTAAGFDASAIFPVDLYTTQVDLLAIDPIKDNYSIVSDLKSAS